MGIRSSLNNDMSLPMFGDDILRVEITGPDVGCDQVTLAVVC
jgi:hypothetical protein